MRNEILKTVIIGLVTPAMLAGLAVGAFRRPEPQMESTSTGAATQTTARKPSSSQLQTSLAPTTAAPTLPPEKEPVIIQVVMEEEVKKMALEEYLLGVLLAEVPAKFHVDALKAQAVASRTYTLMCCTVKKSHSVGAVCTQSSCCQAYISPETYILRGGKWAEVERMRQALESTEGMVITYEDKLILATYFACSGGSTEAAVAVWGADYPYLQAVDSPGEEEVSYYTDEKIFTPEDFLDALGIHLEGEAESWFAEAVYTSGGGVKTMNIGGVSYRGTTLRSLLGLRSTAFTVSFQDGFIFFKTKGYGHRVGMSQYGADAMAQKGSSFEEILLHYYTGTSLRQYNP